MDNTNLFLIRIILACIVMGLATSTKSKATDITHRLEPSLKSGDTAPYIPAKSKLDSHKHVPKIEHKKHHKKNKKSKRDAYSNKYNKWASKSSNFGYGEYSSNLPLYLVYNRKVGAYYPFYKYPKENSIRRRNSYLRNVPRN